MRRDIISMYKNDFIRIIKKISVEMQYGMCRKKKDETMARTGSL